MFPLGEENFLSDDGIVLSLDAEILFGIRKRLIILIIAVCFSKRIKIA
jgi:hypothetical protein